MRGPSVICRVLNSEDARADAILEGVVGGALVTERDHGKILHGFCCGTAFPKQEGEKAARAHHTFCPVWEAVEEAQAERREKERLYGLPDQPKILGEDPEVMGDILGIDPEQVQREQDRFRQKQRERMGAEADERLGTETKVGVEAMEEIATDPEWEESE